MHVCRESDGLIVPTKRANKVGAYALAAESAEERRPTKGNAPQAHLRRTQSRGCESQGLWRVRQGREAGRHMNPRQELYEVIPHVRIRAGGRSQGRSLPRLRQRDESRTIRILTDRMRAVPPERRRAVHAALLICRPFASFQDSSRLRIELGCSCKA